MVLCLTWVSSYNCPLAELFAFTENLNRVFVLQKRKKTVREKFLELKINK